MNSVTYLVIAALAVTTLLRFWLNLRQQRSIKRHHDTVPADFAEQISLQEHQKAADYSLARLRFGQLTLTLEAVIFSLWVFGGGINLLNSLSLSLELSAVWSGVVLIFAYAVISMLIDLPASLYQTFKLEASFGFNRSTLTTFIMDRIKGLLLMLVLGVPLLAGILWIVSALGNYWWIAAWGVWTGFMLLMIWIFPNWIAPLFNEFKPLNNEQLRDKIEQLLSRCGFNSNGIFVMDGSKRSSHGNAYFTGIGNNKRIVFFDTLLNGMEDRHVEAVLAHELGHFKHKHIRQGLIISLVTSAIGFFILSLLMQWPEFYSGLMIDSPNPAVALLLFMLVSPLFTFVLNPLTSAHSRRNEYQADEYAAKQTNAQDLIDALTRLYRDNASTLTPDPLYSLFYDSHPPAALRVAALHNRSSS